MTYYPALGVSQPALMDILNTISDIVFTIARDDDGMWRFTMVNQRFLEATGLKPDAVFGQRVVPEDAEREAVCDPAEPVVELAERRLVTARQQSHEGLV